MKQTLGNLRTSLFLISWGAALSSVVWTSDQNLFINFGVVSFSIFLVLTFPHIKRQSLFIIGFLLFIYILIVREIPDTSSLIEGGNYILVFAGLIPTMGLVRATAQKLENVKQSQILLSKLPKESCGSGFQITAHFFGSVINTGVFAMLAAAMPPKSGFYYRKLVAESVLRGMSSSATWSPFFVAFVVGQVYLDAISAWIGLAIGLIMGSVFSMISITLLTHQLTWKKLQESIACLKPMLPTLLITMTLVVGSAIFFNLTALSAVIIVMPILVGCYLFTIPANIKPIGIETLIYLKQNTDDIVVISVAMLVGFFVTNSPDALATFHKLNLLMIPSWSVLIFIPLTMASLSLIGIHPVISSTVLLSVFTSSQLNISTPLLMQAHLLGWCTGTMSSIASLSVITCSTLFQIPSTKLCFGINALTTLIFAFLGGILLALMNEFNNSFV